MNNDKESGFEGFNNLSLNMDKIKSNLPIYSSEKLCEMIVCDRYFGFNQEIAIICMEELAKRRVEGNDFPFEDYIEAAFKKLPKLDLLGIPDLRTMLSQIIGRKIK